MLPPSLFVRAAVTNQQAITPARRVGENSVMDGVRAIIRISLSPFSLTWVCP